uniref:Exocrine gland-secreting peptide 25 n=1 Tax=Mus musculus TaxID=10090 RepID=A8R0V7_MOUSE|nr:exocrine gland-secreting peptide 25 [Mus musculus]
MASFPVMHFLIILLLTSVVTEVWVLKQTQEELTTSTDSLVLFDCNYIQSISNSVANLILEDHKDNTFLKTEPKDIECL